MKGCLVDYLTLKAKSFSVFTTCKIFFTILLWKNTTVKKTFFTFGLLPNLLKQSKSKTVLKHFNCAFVNKTFQLRSDLQLKNCFVLHFTPNGKKGFRFQKLENSWNFFLKVQGPWKPLLTPKGYHCPRSNVHCWLCLQRVVSYALLSQKRLNLPQR